jgi:SAM-dependent methyltransferase
LIVFHRGAANVSAFSPGAFFHTPQHSGVPLPQTLSPVVPESRIRSLPPVDKISAATVRDDFNDLLAVLHYTRAAHELGLWQSEQVLIERYFPDRSKPLIEAGCGAGRVTLGLWSMGYHNLTAFDFARELLDQARSLAAERSAETIDFLHADATALASSLAARSVSGNQGPDKGRPGHFGGALFMFNGMMQIPGRENRRAALRELHRVCAPGSPLLFTSHDRDCSPAERVLWRLEKARWDRGEQDPRLVEFGDRYFEEAGTGRTFMHLPDRAEILADLALTGWTHTFDAMREDVAREKPAVLDFSDECRFWVAHRS